MPLSPCEMSVILGWQRLQSLEGEIKGLKGEIDEANLQLQNFLVSVLIKQLIVILKYV